MPSHHLYINAQAAQQCQTKNRRDEKREIFLKPKITFYSWDEEWKHIGSRRGASFFHSFI